MQPLQLLHISVVIVHTSTGSHAERTVEADGFAVEHRVFADVLYQSRKLRGLAETRGKWNALAERFLHFRRETGHHGCLEDSGRNGDDANAEADLGVFSNKFGLPTCTTSNGCFTKMYETSRKPVANANWAVEISLDLQWAHAIAPQLIRTRTNA